MRLLMRKILMAITASRSSVWTRYRIPMKKYSTKRWKTSFPNNVRKIPAMHIPVNANLLMKIAAHSLGSWTEQTLLGAGQQSFKQYQQNWWPQGHDICGQPVVFSMGISQRGHLLVRKRKQTNPTIDLRSSPPAVVSTAEHLGHRWPSALPQRQDYTVKTKSQLSDGHFSMSAVKALYFLNKNSYSSTSSDGRRVFKARQISMGSLPQKGEMTSLPVLQEICEMKVLICWYQQSQQMPVGRCAVDAYCSKLQQHISQVMAGLKSSCSSGSVDCIQKIIRVQLNLNYRYYSFDT